MRLILNHLIDTLAQGQPAILCAIIRNLGSSPRSSGARMLVMQDGTIFGSIGGGVLEKACQNRAAELLSGKVTFAELNFHLNADSAAEAGMVCGGSVSVLLQRVGTKLLPLLHEARRLLQAGKKPMILTFLPKNDQPPHLQLLAEEAADIPTGLQSEILSKNRRAPFLLEYMGNEIFVEPLASPGTVYLAGAGHVGLATAGIAGFIGFEVVVMDDRQAFANTNRFPGAREVLVLDSFTNCLEDLDPDDYIIITTRGHLQDREVLAQALRTDAGYIGMIGSQRKRTAVYESLKKEGFSDADLARVHCPIGLAIGADTPEEIALSIVAELVQVRAGMNK